MNKTMFNKAIQLFDEYNKRDPNKTTLDGNTISNSVLYAKRMTAKLLGYKPDASELLQLAARSQHIGRWEIPRKDFPMDRKGYLQWRSQLKIYHAKIASEIMNQVGYDKDFISKVEDLLLKKQLKQNQETQTFEDVICLVFLEFYFDDFSEEHNEEKLVKILQKTMAKMSIRGVDTALQLPLSAKAKNLISKASS